MALVARSGLLPRSGAFTSIVSAVVLPFALLAHPATAQTADTIEIGMLVDQMTPVFQPLVSTMMAEVAAVVGADATIEFSASNLVANDFNLENARVLYEALQNEVDVIFAIGPITGEVVLERNDFTTPTILFGAVNEDLINLGDGATTSEVSNFTFVVTPQSFGRDLRTFRELYDYERVGVLFRTPQDAVPTAGQALAQQFAELGADFEIIQYTTPAALEPYLGRVDAFYLAESWGIPDDELRDIADRLIDHGIPSFSGVRRQDVELGILATSQSEENLDQFFRRIALHVEAVVRGENLSDRPVFIDLNETLTINFNTAELVGVPLRYSLIATTQFVGDFVNSISEQTYSLLDVVTEAVDENLALEVERRQVELAGQDVKAAWSNYLPSISAVGTGNIVDPSLAELSGGRNPQYSALGSLELRQTLFSPGANANIQIQKQFLRAQDETFRAAELDLILEAANAYFNALILKANLRIQKQNVDVTNRNLIVAEQNFEVGQAGRGDVLRLQSAAARDMQALVQAINQLEQSFYAINQLLNNPINREIDVEDATVAGGPLERADYDELRLLLDDPSVRVVLEDFLVAEALAEAPELVALDYNVAAAERTIALNGAQRFLPTLAGVAQYNRTFDQGGVGAPPEAQTLSDNYNIGFQLSIPLFDSNLRNIDRQSARLQRTQLQLNREFTADAIDRNVRDVVLELANQTANIELSAVSEAAATEGLELTETAYANGAATIVELLDAQTNLLQAQLASANATYNFLSASIALGRLIGHYFILSTEEQNDDFVARFEAYQASRLQEN